MGLTCWTGKEEQYEFGTDEWAEAVVNGATCLLPDGHDGPHEWTPNDDFVIEFAKKEDQMTLTEYVEKQIVKLFDDVAEQVSSGKVALDGYSEDEWAAMPMAIFMAQQYMIRCWREFVNKEEA